MFSKKRLIKIGFFLLAAIIALVGIYLLFIVRASNCSPGGCADVTLRKTNKPKYELMSGYSDGSRGYQCSKPIKMVSNTITKIQEYTNFRPVDPEEARVFCHATSVIEYKGKLTVLQRPEVLELISKYEYKDINIKALEFKYIEDKNFINRILPAFMNKEIGCIIIVETPNEKKVYLEDEELETFEEIDYKVFESNFAEVSVADRQLFLDNLK